MATLTREQSATSTGSGNQTATFSTAPTEGNLLIAVAADRSGATSASMVSSGWTLGSDQFIEPTDGTYRRSLIVWYKIAGSSESTDVTTNVDGNTHYLVVEEYSVSEGEFSYSTFAENNNGTTTDALSVATGTTTSLSSGDYVLIGAFGHKKDNSNASAWDATGWSSEALTEGHADWDSTSYGRGIATGYLLQESTSGTKASTYTIGSAFAMTNTGLAAAILVFEITTAGGGATAPTGTLSGPLGGPLVGVF